MISAIKINLNFSCVFHQSLGINKKQRACIFFINFYNYLMHFRYQLKTVSFEFRWLHAKNFAYFPTGHL